MKLYRGLTEKPILVTDEVAKEFDELKASWPEILRQTREAGQPTAKFERYCQLYQATLPQCFCDEEIIAKEVAKENGYLLAIDVPDAEAVKYFHSSQTMQRGEVLRYPSNFMIDSVELARHFVEWRGEIKELRPEREPLEMERRPKMR